MEPKLNKVKLLELITAERMNWDALVAQVAQDRMTQAGVSGDWSAKDVIGHLTAWEERPVAWLEAAQSRALVKPPDWPQGLDETETNAWIFRMNRDRPLSDLLKESERVHKRLVELIERTPEDELIEPDRVGGLEGSALIDAIPGDTYEHYRGHAALLREWLSSSK